MLEGWYCRSLANQKNPQSMKTERETLESDDELQIKPPGAVSQPLPGTSSSASTGTANANVDYKERYKNLKRKLKFLVYENEYFQDLLHTNQRRLLKVSRDRSFLIDRLLLYEKPAKDSSDSDATDSSNSDVEATTSTGTTAQHLPDPAKDAVRQKHKDKTDPKMAVPSPHTVSVAGAPRGRRRKILAGGIVTQQPGKKQTTVMATVTPSLQQLTAHQLAAKDSPVALSTAEITRQLQERRPTPIELMSPECASATVPATMLSDESPSKLYPNESLQHLMEDDSPSHVAAEECVPMVYTEQI